MIRSIMDDVRATDDACKSLVAAVSKMEGAGCAEIKSEAKLERESLVK